MDREQFNNLERALSNDINDLQSLKDRAILDMLRATWSIRITSGGFVGLADQPRNVVLAGLSTIPAGGNDVSVTPGVLLQDSAVLPPVPGPIDSTYRIGINRAATTVAIPVPGVDTSFLVEGQMVEVITLNTLRDVYNVGLGVFVPALVDKRAERRIAFQVVAGAGGNAPAPSGGDWVPISVVRRQPPFAPIVLADIMQVRPTIAERVPNGQEFFTVGAANLPASRLRTTHEPGGAVSNLVELEAHAYPSGGGRAEFRGAGSAIDPTTAEVLSPGLVLAASTTYYLYLCPWSAQRLLPEIGTIARGILVLSDVTPSALARTNSAGIALPAPWNVAPAGGFTCVAVAALRRNSTNNGWDWSVDAGDGRYALEQLAVASIAAPPAVNTIALAGLVPTQAKTARVRVRWIRDAAGTVAATLEARPVGAGADYDRITWDWTNSGACEFEIPMQPSTSFDLVLSGATRPTLLEVDLIGWSEA